MEQIVGSDYVEEEMQSKQMVASIPEQVHGWVGKTVDSVSVNGGEMGEHPFCFHSSQEYLVATVFHFVSVEVVQVIGPDDSCVRV